MCKEGSVVKLAVAIVPSASGFNNDENYGITVKTEFLSAVVTGSVTCL